MLLHHFLWDIVFGGLGCRVGATYEVPNTLSTSFLNKGALLQVDASAAIWEVLYMIQLIRESPLFRAILVAP